MFINKMTTTFFLLQFDLVCQRRYLVATIQATYMAGVFAGSLIMGSLSDKLVGF